jgi:hypothetical protein
MDSDRRLASLVVLGLLLSLPGCLSTTLYETARVCPPWDAEVTLASTPWLWRSESTRFVLEQWYDAPGPELSVRVSPFRNLDVGVRVIPAPGGCITTKYQFLRAPVDVAVTAAGFAYMFAAIDAGGRWLGAYGGLLASNEVAGRVPFSVQALLRYEYTDVGSYFSNSYKAGLWAASLGAGVPVRVNVGRSGALRIHPAASINLPLSWRFWDWSYKPYHEPTLPPTQTEQWRGVMTLDVGVGLTAITAR